MHRKTKRAVVASVLLAAMALSACTADIRKTGYYPLQQELEAINVGLSTRSDVLAQVGSPSLGAPQTDDVIYYVGQKMRYLGPLKPQVVDRQVVAVSFDSKDRVSNVQVLGLADGKVVVISQRVTETVAGNYGFFKQLFGNIGNVSADQILGG